MAYFYGTQTGHVPYGQIHLAPRSILALVVLTIMMAAWGVLPNRSGYTAYILLDILLTISIRDVDDYYRVDVCREDITTTTNLRKKDVFHMKVCVHIF